MTHTDELSFEDLVANWFRGRFGEAAVSQQAYIADPHWFCDIVVEMEFGTAYIEVESRESEVRAGVGQALGYAASDPIAGFPMVVTPRGHLEEVRAQHLRESTTVLIREFDEERGEFVR